MDWKRTAVLLGVYGFFKEFRPCEPFITKLLTGPDKNLTAEQVNQEIYPVCTYANFAFLVVLFLVTDWLRYKPVLVAQGLTAIAVYAIIIWGEGLFIMQVMQVLYGLMWAADVSYFTYLFAKAGREHFSDAAAATRMGYLVGKFCSGVVSQVVVSTGVLSLMDLAYISLGSVAVSAVIAVVMPSAKVSMYFHKDQVPKDAQLDDKPRSHCAGLLTVAKLLWTDFRDAYKQSYVLKWSLWWAAASGGQEMVLSYVQILWQETVSDSQKSDSKLWNGAVEALSTILGAVVTWLATRRKSYKLWDDVVLASWAIFAGVLVLGSAAAQIIALQYALYVVLYTTYHGAITVATSEVAQHIRDDSQALVYGVNTLLSTLLQTVITAAVTGKGSLELGIRAQFYVFGSYFVVLGVVFVVVALVTKCLKRAGVH